MSGLAEPAAARRPAVRVAFQGERGAYSEDAIAAYWAGAAEPMPTRECVDAVAAVVAGAATHAMLPVENTLAGTVAAAYDALADAPVAIVGEIVLPIHHCVLALPGAALDTLAAVESHPVALAQCRRFLARHPRLEVRPAYDTAGAARAVAARGDAACGAIAGRAAAAHFGLAVLAADVEDRADNQTRFVAIAREPRALAAGTPARTALVAETANVPGALLRLLAPLAAEGLNLGKLESRPTGVPWTYRFLLELEHAAGDAAAERALAAVALASRSLRVLGTFARVTADAPPPAAAVEPAHA